MRCSVLVAFMSSLMLVTGTNYHNVCVFLDAVVSQDYSGTVTGGQQLTRVGTRVTYYVPRYKRTTASIDGVSKSCFIMEHTILYEALP